jgi:hypothetical protein
VTNRQECLRQTALNLVMAHCGYAEVALPIHFLCRRGGGGEESTNLQSPTSTDNVYLGGESFFRWIIQVKIRGALDAHADSVLAPNTLSKAVWNGRTHAHLCLSLTQSFSSARYAFGINNQPLTKTTGFCALHIHTYMEANSGRPRAGVSRLHLARVLRHVWCGA